MFALTRSTRAGPNPSPTRRCTGNATSRMGYALVEQVALPQRTSARIGRSERRPLGPVLLSSRHKVWGRSLRRGFVFLTFVRSGGSPTVVVPGSPTLLARNGAFRSFCASITCWATPRSLCSKALAAERPPRAKNQVVVRGTEAVQPEDACREVAVPPERREPVEVFEHRGSELIIV